jgi:hypothetical protein
MIEFAWYPKAGACTSASLGVFGRRSGQPGTGAIGLTMLSDCRGLRGSAILQSLCGARITR